MSHGCRSARPCAGLARRTRVALPQQAADARTLVRNTDQKARLILWQELRLSFERPHRGRVPVRGVPWRPRPYTSGALTTEYRDHSVQLRPLGYRHRYVHHFQAHAAQARRHDQTCAAACCGSQQAFNIWTEVLCIALST
jgi:hypothetical protein